MNSQGTTPVALVRVSFLFVQLDLHERRSARTPVGGIGVE